MSPPHGLQVVDDVVVEHNKQAVAIMARLAVATVDLHGPITSQCGAVPQTSCWNQTGCWSPHCPCGSSSNCCPCTPPSNCSCGSRSSSCPAGSCPCAAGAASAFTTAGVCGYGWLANSTIIPALEKLLPKKRTASKHDDDAAGATQAAGADAADATAAATAVAKQKEKMEQREQREQREGKTVRLWVGSPMGFWGGPINTTKQSELLAELAQLADVVVGALILVSCSHECVCGTASASHASSCPTHPTRRTSSLSRSSSWATSRTRRC